MNREYILQFLNEQDTEEHECIIRDVDYRPSVADIIAKHIIACADELRDYYEKADDECEWTSERDMDER